MKGQIVNDKLNVSISTIFQGIRDELYELKSELALLKESGQVSPEQVFFNAYSSREVHCFDCTVPYENEYADSHNAMDHKNGR